MTLKDKIIADMKTAMKAQDSLSLGVLRMIKAEIMKFEVSGANAVVDDEKVIEILKRGLKQRKEAAEGFRKGGNEEAAVAEESEIVILEKYLPEQMGEDQLRGIVQQVIDQLSAGPADFGKVMGVVMGKVKGQADGGMVNKVVKELLS